MCVCEWFFFRARGDYDVHNSCAYLLRWLFFTREKTVSLLMLFFAFRLLFRSWKDEIAISFLFFSFFLSLSVYDNSCRKIHLGNSNFIYIVDLFWFLVFLRTIIIDQQNWLILHIYIKLVLYLHRLSFHLFLGYFFFNFCFNSIYAYKKQFQILQKINNFSFFYSFCVLKTILFCLFCLVWLCVMFWFLKYDFSLYVLSLFFVRCFDLLKKIN